ncbi:uncharacterized protein LOC135500961 [Lineus longissimus]|uniref:uncharacterized protein LOC135500961 n=1 Tax=Lineus longissimus TaxID=88925 RepID=UPI00315C8542
MKEICDPDSAPDRKATVVGTRWNLAKDTLSVKEVASEDYAPTKRNILKKVASYYDVFGVLAAVTIRPRMLLQKLWQFDLGWDTELSNHSDLYVEWQTIERDLKDVGKIEIPRCLIPEKYKGMSPLPDVSLHGSSDASENAMGVTVHLRWSESEDHPAELTFVCARARVTPLKQTSIPRKELQALLLLCRLLLSVRSALRLDIQYTKLWTDSMTAIRWLRGQSKSFRSYVACRVGEISTDFDPVKDIAYIPTDQNIADLISRGVTADRAWM